MEDLEAAKGFTCVHVCTRVTMTCSCHGDVFFYAFEVVREVCLFSTLLRKVCAAYLLLFHFCRLISVLTLKCLEKILSPFLLLFVGFALQHVIYSYIVNGNVQQYRIKRFCCCKKNGGQFWDWREKRQMANYSIACYEIECQLHSSTALVYSSGNFSKKVIHFCTTVFALPTPPVHLYLLKSNSKGGLANCLKPCAAVPFRDVVLPPWGQGLLHSAPSFSLK